VAAGASSADGSTTLNSARARWAAVHTILSRKGDTPMEASERKQPTLLAAIGCNLHVRPGGDRCRGGIRESRWRACHFRRANQSLHTPLSSLASDDSDKKEMESHAHLTPCCYVHPARLHSSSVVPAHVWDTWPYNIVYICTPALTLVSNNPSACM